MGKSKIIFGLFMMLFSAGCQSVEKKDLKDIQTEEKEEKEPCVQGKMEVGPMFTMYKLGYAYDHSIIYSDEDEKWHLYGIEGGNKSFIHLTATSLTQEGWEKHKSFKYKDMEIWAPHIIKHEDIYYMYYTSIGVPRAIRLATSKDLWNWEHPSDDPVFAWKNEYTNNMKNKDPMVFWDEVNNQWVMYVSMLKDAKHWVVGYATSKDLLKWTEPSICFDEHTTSPGIESPFVVKRGEYYYLFLSARPWPHGAEEVFKSKDPYNWKVTDLVKSINPWHAAEVIQDHDGQWYLSRSSGNQNDFRMAPLYWNDCQ